MPNRTNPYLAAIAAAILIAVVVGVFLAHRSSVQRSEDLDRAAAVASEDVRLSELEGQKESRRLQQRADEAEAANGSFSQPRAPRIKALTDEEEAELAELYRRHAKRAADALAGKR